MGACSNIEKVYINSDSPQYIDIGVKYGAEPYLRSPHIANSTTTMQQVISDFINHQDIRKHKYDAIMDLYPTYPFRSPEQLNRIITFFEEHDDCSSVVGLKQPETHPYLCVSKDDDKSIKTYIDYDINSFYRRQDYPKCYELSAWAMVISTKHIDQLNAQMLGKNTKGYIIEDTAEVIDIDTLKDFQYAEFIMQKNYRILSK